MKGDSTHEGTPRADYPQGGHDLPEPQREKYLCAQYINVEAAVMVREPDGWTLTAHGVRQYLDGTIEWDYSTDGRWPDGKPL